MENVYRNVYLRLDMKQADGIDSYNTKMSLYLGRITQPRQTDVTDRVYAR